MSLACTLSSMKQSPDVDMVCDDFPKGHAQTSWQSLLNIFQALHLRCLPVSVEQHLWNLIVPRCSKKARLGPAVKKRQLLDEKIGNPSPFVPFFSASCVKNALHILVRFKSGLGVGPTSETTRLPWSCWCGNYHRPNVFINVSKSRIQTLILIRLPLKGDVIN